MGGGKSSVLSPVLTMLMEQHGFPFIIILPQHLVKDTVLPLLQYRSLYIRDLRYVLDENEDPNIINIDKLIIDTRYNYVLSATA